MTASTQRRSAAPVLAVAATVLIVLGFGVYFGQHRAKDPEHVLISADWEPSLRGREVTIQITTSGGNFTVHQKQSPYSGLFEVVPGSPILVTVSQVEKGVLHCYITSTTTNILGDISKNTGNAGNVSCRRP
jgi:hypothetical protein